MTRRVVITGSGTINALGHNVHDTWEKMINGVSGVDSITLFDTSDMNVRIACEVKDFDPAQYMEPRKARKRDRFEQFAIVAANEALIQSGLEVNEENASRIGVIVSSAIGGLGTIQDSVRTMDSAGPRRVSPFLIPMFMPNGASGLIAIEVGAKGPCFSLASACASASDSIGQAAWMIRTGVIDVCVAGGSEAPITEIGISAFDRLGAMSRKMDGKDGTPKPFDRDRDGLVMAEGAAVLILEELEHAKARGAEILAELVGFAATADAYHVTAPSENGEGSAAAIIAALEDGGVAVEDVGYINAHGTATLLNDLAETRAIKTALGDHAYNVPVSSTKSMTGHMMGATGGVEAIACILAIRHGIVPPTINLTSPDPACDLDYVPWQAREHEVGVVLNNAFGFGGHNAVLAFRAFPG